MHLAYSLDLKICSSLTCGIIPCLFYHIPNTYHPVPLNYPSGIIIPGVAHHHVWELTLYAILSGPIYSSSLGGSHWGGFGCGLDDPPTHPPTHTCTPIPGGGLHCRAGASISEVIYPTDSISTSSPAASNTFGFIARG